MARHRRQIEIAAQGRTALFAEATAVALPGLLLAGMEAGIGGGGLGVAQHPGRQVGQHGGRGQQPHPDLGGEHRRLGPGRQQGGDRPLDLGQARRELARSAASQATTAGLPGPGGGVPPVAEAVRFATRSSR